MSRTIKVVDGMIVTIIGGTVVVDYPERKPLPPEEYKRVEKMYTELKEISRKYNVTIITATQKVVGKVATIPTTGNDMCACGHEAWQHRDSDVYQGSADCIMCDCSFFGVIKSPL